MNTLRWALGFVLGYVATAVVLIRLRRWRHFQYMTNATVAVLVVVIVILWIIGQPLKDGTRLAPAAGYPPIIVETNHQRAPSPTQ